LIVLAVDPGKRKCGVAVVGAAGILARRVVPREEIFAQVRQWCEEHAVECLLVGDSTGSKEVVAELVSGLPAYTPQVVDEKFTTERARKRYFVDHPPRGLWRLVPLGLQVPPVPVDDYAAVVMAEDFMAKGATS